MVCRMSSEVVSSPGGDPDTLDLSGHGMEKLTRATPELILNTTTLILDNNSLGRLDNIHTYQCLEKLSVSNNQLIRMFQVGKLHHLKVLDLSSNNIVTIEGLKDINLLTWLSLANNNIKTIENLSQNVHLEHLDLSGNAITYITDMSSLKNLKTLMLHKNKIGTLRSCSSSLPGSIATLTLSDNQLTELRDVSHLAHLSRLDQLTLAENTCIKQPDEIECQFDHRPYVINWCLSLRMLDGIMVGAKESLKAEWMYSQSKGRQFGPGEQIGLVEYLIQTCPLDPNQETEQDRKLNLILSKVQEHQSSLRQPRQIPDGYATIPRSNSSESKKSAPSTPRRNSGPNQIPEIPSKIPTPGHASTPSSTYTTPVNTPGLVRRHSTGRGSRLSRSRSSPTPKKTAVIPPAHYKMELPPTLYGDDLVNGNTDLMTQSMDPSVLVARLDNGQSEDAMSVSSIDLMSQSVDVNMLRDNLNERGMPGTPSHREWISHSPARPRTLFSNRGSTDSGIRSDDQLEIQDISDSESGNVMPGFARLQSRLNPVPESLNSPDIAPGPSPPRRDDPMISGPLNNLPHDLEIRLNAARQCNSNFPPNKNVVTTPGPSQNVSPRLPDGSKRPSEVMVAAVTARTSAPKTPGHNVVARPTSAVKPVNIISKVDSGLSRGGAGRTPVARAQRSHSAGPPRKNSLPNRQVAALKSSKPAQQTPDISRKQAPLQPLSLADDEASDTENEFRKNSEPVPKPRTRKSSQESSVSSRGRNIASRRNTSDQMSKSTSIAHIPQSSQSRPRSTSLTRSQSQRLGRGMGSAKSSGERTPQHGVVRPRSSTLTTPTHSRGQDSTNNAARNIQAGWRGHNTRNRDPEVREVKEELRNMRLEAHTKQLSKELRSARAALEQERKLRKVQSDTIKVLWKEIQSLQMENEMDYNSFDNLNRQHFNEMGRGYSGDVQRATLSKNMRVTERKLSRLLAGASMYEDSDSSRGEELGGDHGSGSSTSADHDRSVADLTRTCSNLQTQVEQLQANLANVIHYVSERSRHSSSSQDTPPLLRPIPIMTTSLDFGGPPTQPNLPNSMTMSLPPSLLLPAPVTISRSCDSLAQTDIVAVRTPQTEGYQFLNTRKSQTDVDTSDSDHTKLDSCKSSPPRPKSPRPRTLPGVSDGVTATPKKIPPRGSDIPGMPASQGLPSPPGPPAVRSYASNIVEGLLSQMGKEVSKGVDTADDVTDISMSFDTDIQGRGLRNNPQTSTSPRPSSRSSQRTVESDSLEDSPKKSENGDTPLLQKAG